MKAEERQQKILQALHRSDTPISGAQLSEQYFVSRQIIVKDILTLRTKGFDIMSTTKGYVLNGPIGYERIFKVQHTDEEIADELNLIVDLGATVEDVFIYHKVYGEMRAKLNIRSRRDVKTFCQALVDGKSRPLKNATSGFHYHTISAESEDILDCVKEELSKAGYLAPATDFEPAGAEFQD